MEEKVAGRWSLVAGCWCLRNISGLFFGVPGSMELDVDLFDGGNQLAVCLPSPEKHAGRIGMDGLGKQHADTAGHWIPDLPSRQQKLAPRNKIHTG